MGELMGMTPCQGRGRKKGGKEFTLPHRRKEKRELVGVYFLL